MKRSHNYLHLIILLILFYACAPASESKPTPTPKPTYTPLPTATPLPSPTSTLEPQKLGRVFSNGFSSQSVWSNADGDTDREIGWHCPKGEGENCRDLVIHFDVSLPNNFSKGDFILSPVDGSILKIYSTGEGMSIQIMPNSPIEGISDLVLNKQRIDTLSKNIYTFDYEPSDIHASFIHLAHVIPLVSINESVSKGQEIAKIEYDVWFTPKLAYVLYLQMKDNRVFQFSPCDVPNEDEFCGKCTTGTPYICP